MADKTNYIKIDRNILQWRWFKDSKILHVFLFLLLKANIKEGHFQKDVIHRGSLATSNAHIAEECGLTLQNVRTALADLESTGEITRQNRNHYQIITIANYEVYQNRYSRNSRANDSDIPETIAQLTGNSQATNNNQRNKEYKNKRNIPPKSPKGDSSPSGTPKRGTDEFRNQSHLLLKQEEGTVDDIPERYREICNNDFAVYWGMRNQ